MTAEPEKQAEPRLTLLAIAEICHEANCTFCKYLGDVPACQWSGCAEELQRSCLQGVLTVLNRPEITSEQSHALWRDERTSQGWVYGPVLDRDHKVHPNLVDYDQLPLGQRFKDHLFRSIVLAAMSAAAAQA